jgi:hypothetical protein
VSPILVRPVREQFEHDRIIRVLQAKYKRKYEVAINPGAEQNASISVGELPMYPDLVLISNERGRKVQATVEVETTESINTLEAMAEWGPFSRVRAAFYLYVPAATIDNVRRLCNDHGIVPAEIWTYHAALDQVRFTMVHRAADSARPADARVPKLVINTPPKPPEPRVAAADEAQPAAAAAAVPATAASRAAKAAEVRRIAEARPARGVDVRPRPVASPARATQVSNGPGRATATPPPARTAQATRPAAPPRTAPPPRPAPVVPAKAAKPSPLKKAAAPAPKPTAPPSKPPAVAAKVTPPAGKAAAPAGKAAKKAAAKPLPRAAASRPRPTAKKPARPAATKRSATPKR